MSNQPLPSNVGRPAQPASQMLAAGFFLIAIGALYVGQGIIVPLVLTILVAFALAPLVGLLRRLHIPIVVAVILSVALTALVITLLGLVLATQLARLAGDLPQYQQTIIQKLVALQTSLGANGLVDRIDTLMQMLASGSTVSPTAPLPFPVTVANGPSSSFVGIRGVFGSVLGPLATGAIVTLFVVFLLLQKDDLRDRFLKLVSNGNLRISTEVMNESAARVSRYLVAQLGVNAIYGVILGLGLSLVAVPNALLWGLLAALFRYIPFVGTLIAISIPVALAFALDPGWSRVIEVIVLYGMLELVTTNGIEPRLYGARTGLSPIAVLLSALFWATLWGPIGLILALPLTVCLVVLGRHVPQLRFLEVILGTEPVLSPMERLYQRLLAGNVEEAIELAEAEIEMSSPLEFFDSIAIPLLLLAQSDLRADEVSPGQGVAEGMSSLIQEIGVAALTRGTGANPAPVASDLASPRVVAAGGKSALDGSAAEMIAQIVGDAGIGIQLLPPSALRREELATLELNGIEVVCAAYIGPNPKAYIRYLARRLKRRNAGIRIIACVFDAAAEAMQPVDLGVDAVATNLADTQLRIAAWLAPQNQPHRYGADVGRG